MTITSTRSVTNATIHHSSQLAQPDIIEASNESDSNAYTCYLGRNFIVYAYTSRTADVCPYDNEYTPTKDIPIVTGATAYIDRTSVTYILLINEALFYGDKLDHSLLNLNQLHAYGIEYWDNPYNNAHDTCIHIPNILTIPLQFFYTKTQFKSRTPTSGELQKCMHIELKSIMHWNPYDIKFGKQI